ncbi:glycosyltransferase, partial [Gammaproteobacteria bacterium]|nr:glycosyltransferase [Gammaproteobacteria bacterium]
MRILLFAPQPFFSERGTPIAIRLLARTLCEAGYQVDLLTFAQGDEVEFDGLRIIRASAIPGVQHVPIGLSWQKIVSDVALYFRARRLMADNTYDVIHAVEESVFIASLMKRRHRSKLVFDMDSSMTDQLIEKWSRLRLFKPVFEAFERFALKRSDLVLPVCDSLALRAEEICPGRPQQVLQDIADESHEAD